MNFFYSKQIWALPSSNVKIVPRDEPLSRVRVASVFAGSQKLEPTDADKVDGEYQPFDKEREVCNIPKYDKVSDALIQ